MDNPQDIDKYDPKFLTSSSGDYIYATGLGVLSLILSALVPGAGILANLVGVNQLAPMMKRLDRWIAHAQEAIRQLQDEGMTIEDLVQREEFVTAVLQTSQAAMRTHQEEKLKALRNALLNIGMGLQTDENKQQMFIVLIDELTPDHLKVLEICSTQAGIRRNLGPLGDESLVQYYERVNPQANGQWWAYLRMIVATLNGRGLLLGDGLEPAVINGTAVTSVTGLEFLAFTRSPFEQEANQEPEKDIE